MLRKVASEYPGKTIHIILDNARYQKCAIVQALAKELGIILQYIPPYSPNLNLIERVWKFVKAELRSKYYDDFSAFQMKIDSIIESTSKGNLTKIKRLIGEKVQLFDDMKSVTENTFECSAKRQIHAA
jgi:transposase